VTPAELVGLRLDSGGFNGRFRFVPEHTEDRGFGNIHDCAKFDDELVYVPADADENDHDEVYVVADLIEQHVAEPIARMLNATGPLLSHIAALESQLAEARDEIENGTCARHAGQQHGLEAEELRHGVEDILRNTDWKDMRAELQRLLDETDARDSLAYLERRDEQLAEARALGLEACRVANVALGRLSHIEHPADWYADTERVNEIRARLEGK
jgi:hypothetical protein